MVTLAGCGEGDRTIKSAGLQTGQELLQKFINIPKPADRVKFEIIPSGTDEAFGPVDYRMIALLFYSQGDFEELTKTSAKGKVFAFTPPDWLKEELFSEHFKGDELQLENTRQVAPNNYLRSPYLHGEVIALDKMNALLIMFHTQ